VAGHQYSTIFIYITKHDEYFEDDIYIASIVLSYSHPLTHLKVIVGQILVRYYLGRKRPGNGETGVVVSDSDVSFRMVEIGVRIMNNGIIHQGKIGIGTSMGKKDGISIFRVELKTDMPHISQRI
jgi:hypothetical protein